MTWSVIRKKICKYGAIFAVGYQSRTAYIADLLSRMPLIMLRVWISTQFYGVALSVWGGARFGGYTLQTLVYLIIFVQVFSWQNHPRIAEVITEEIQTGSFAYTINRPYSYIFFHYCSYFGQQIPAMVLRFLSALAALIFLVGAPPIAPGTFCAGLILLFLGLSLDFFISFSLGMLSLWLENALAFDTLYQRMLLFFGGHYIPLDAMPYHIRIVLECLPFAQRGYSISRFMMNGSISYFFITMAIQITWICIMIFVAHTLFKKGQKNVSCSGG